MLLRVKLSVPVVNYANMGVKQSVTLVNYVNMGVKLSVNVVNYGNMGVNQNLRLISDVKYLKKVEKEESPKKLVFGTVS